MAPWDYASAIDVYASGGRHGTLVFIPEDALKALSDGSAAVGRVAVEFSISRAESEYFYLTGPTTWGVTKQLLSQVGRDFHGPNIPPGRSNAADADVIVARLRAAGIG